MGAKVCKAKVCADERLPIFHRTIRLPTALWKAVKARGEREGKAIRWVVDDALDAELMPLIESLRRLGLKGEVEADKLVRVPLDDNVIGRMNFGRRQTGIPAVHLLRVCLERYVTGKVKARGRR